jgi:hypothetical protein
VKSAVVHDDGAVTVTFSMGTITLDVQGKVTKSGTSFNPQAAPPAGANPANVPNPWGGMTMGTMSVSHSAVTLVAAEAVLSLLLAIFLLVTGILVLRQTPGGRKLLLAYALLKLACGVLGIVALSWMIRSIWASDANAAFGYASTMAGMAKGMATAATVLACIGLLFPLAVLLVMLGSKEVRDYYAAM